MSTTKSKVLVLSYFFEPSNFVASQRTEAWAKYFDEFGYTPIILTRNWSDGQSDLLIDSKNNEFSITKKTHFEVHRIPLRIKLRDRLASKDKFPTFRKGLTLAESIFSRFNVRRHTFGGMYDYAQKLIKADPEIKIIIASGSPFQQFHVGYLLKKKFPHLIWLPDYRDEWTTFPTIHKSVFHKFIKTLDRASEKRWTSNADAFVSVSQSLKTDIGKFINKPGIIAKNGFDKSDLDKIRTVKNEYQKDVLVITYIGTLYARQDLTLICEAIRKLENKSVRLEFIGTEIDPDEQKRLLEFQLKYPFIQLIPRKSKLDLYHHIQNTDLCLLIPYENRTSDVPVKIFDYYLLKKCMLFAPSDGGSIADFITTHGCGFLANSVDECTQIIADSLEKKKLHQELISYEIDSDGEHTRKFQTRLLCSAFNSLLQEKT